VQKIVATPPPTTRNSSYGFSGDPQYSPDPSKGYGYLIRAALY